MRLSRAPVLLLIAACSSSTPQPAPQAAAPAAAPAVEALATDTPKQTVAGHTFVAPVGWRFSVRAPATILEVPEGDSHIALVDVEAQTADEAVARAWAAFAPQMKRKVRLATDAPDKDGWSKGRNYEYETSPNEKRHVAAYARQANGAWMVALYDMTTAVGEKRGAQVALIFGRLLPKGYERESFAGRKANALDAARIAELQKFVETARQQLGVPGVSFGLIENGKVVFSGGSGARELGKTAKVDGDTKYLVASNTKGLTTLMLAKLADEKKLTWDTPAAKLLPSFALGDADTTSRVLVRHLVCACTGLPRQDFEWLFQFAGVTPEGVMKTLATMQPTTKFGELYQYSNPLAAAAGFVGGHTAFPELELGKAYDEAMRTRVFEPLGMKSTTLDLAAGMKGNFAAPHAPDADGKTAPGTMAINHAIAPVRPAGGAWSTVNDMLRYVAMELTEGKLPDGKPYIAPEHLLARREQQVAIGTDRGYGMGLMVDRKYGTPIVHHGGDMIGYHSDMMWLPEHGVGAVVLTNGDPGWLIRTFFRRKLLEVLFDARPEAGAELEAAGKAFFEDLAANRKLMTIPAAEAEAAKLAPRYTSAELGDITVTRTGGATIFDFGEWKTPVGTKRNEDGTVSFVTLAPGIVGFDLVAGPDDTLIVRDAQHEYVFRAQR